MNTKIVLLFAMLVVPLKSFALAGELHSPSLSFPADFPQASRTNLLAAITNPAYKFLGGDFVNASTRLRYGGDTKALNLFLQQVSKCPDVSLAISFVSGIEEEPAASWRVSHIGWGGDRRLEVQINLNAKPIHLDELVIPDIQCGANRGQVR